jgi:hypothetical protein
MEVMKMTSVSSDGKKSLILVEGRGAFFRPEGCGDYQPAMYNVPQALRVAYDEIKRGRKPHVRVVIDAGLSPEEYSPTTQFLNRYKRDRDRIVKAMRDGHGITWKPAEQYKLDRLQTNSAAYLVVDNVHDGRDISPEEISLFRDMTGISYSRAEVMWWKKFILNPKFLCEMLNIPNSDAARILDGVTYATYPNPNTTKNLVDIEKDYIDAYIALIQSYWTTLCSRFSRGHGLKSDDFRKDVGKDGYKRLNAFLEAIGIDKSSLKEERQSLSFKFPVDGHITSYFDCRLAANDPDGDAILIQQQDRLGFSGDRIEIPLESFVRRLSDGIPYVISYPLGLARQMVDRNLVHYHPAYNSGPAIAMDDNVDRVFLVAERASPDNPVLDKMHGDIVDQIKRMLGLDRMPGKGMTVLAYPSDRLMNPDEEGKRRRPDEIALDVWNRIKDYEIPGVLIKGLYEA